MAANVRFWLQADHRREVRKRLLTYRKQSFLTSCSKVCL